VTAALRLLRPRYPSVTDTAGYFHIQAAHLRHAIELALGAIAALPEEPDGGVLDPDDVIRDWASDALIQGACRTQAVTRSGTMGRAAAGSFQQKLPFRVPRRMTSSDQTRTSAHRTANGRLLKKLPFERH
jgi:hypothetical protein